jgi:monoamine oxidase
MGEKDNYRVDGGYQKLVAYLEKQCKQYNVEFYLSEEVQQIKWVKNEVEIITDKHTIGAKKVLVTVSVGVLQSEIIRFSPALPEKLAAIKSLGFGHVVKINLQFTEAFWKDESFTKGKDLGKLNFLFSKEAIPTWWTQHPKKEALLIGWLAGPPAEDFTMSSTDIVVQNAITSLSQIFGVEPAILKQKLKESEWHNWSADNHFCGSYSYNVVNGEALIKTVLEPVEHTIYSAGEGLYYGNEIGTVEAALTTGRDVAQNLIAQFSS